MNAVQNPCPMLDAVVNFAIRKGKRHHLERRVKQRKEHSLNALIEVVGLQKVEKASFFQLC
jgi:hypothetical protein